MSTKQKETQPISTIWRTWRSLVTYISCDNHPSNLQQYLKQIHKIDAEYKPHPFYISQSNDSQSVGMGYPFVSIARIDFDKHTDILLQANQQLTNANKPLSICLGAQTVCVSQTYCNLEFSRLLERQVSENN